MTIAGKTGHRSPSTIVGRKFTKLVGKGREIRYGVLIVGLSMDMVVDFVSKSTIFVIFSSPCGYLALGKHN